LEEVSTTCGSGWVNDWHAVLISNPIGTHPLPQVVLTVSNDNFRL